MITDLKSILELADGTNEEVIKRKQFAMYNFEILAEYHLTQDLIVENSANFLEIFTKTLEFNDN